MCDPYHTVICELSRNDDEMVREYFYDEDSAWYSAVCTDKL